jgi:hypothetical protein
VCRIAQCLNLNADQNQKESPRACGSISANLPGRPGVDGICGNVYPLTYEASK